MDPSIRQYLSQIGQRGGKKSRRRLDPRTAREMVKVREARRAFAKYHALCFWSHDPAYRVSAQDLPWVAEQLMKYGNREAWEAASKLCR